jgi:hypothetical protein
MLSPLFALYASVSHLSGIRPAVLCHTFVPGVMTAAFYGAFYEVAHGLFRKDRRKASLFLIFPDLLRMCILIPLRLRQAPFC